MTNSLALPALGITIDRSARPARYTLLALILAVVMFASGFACNVQSWVNNINTILSEVGPAIQIVVSILPLLGKSIPPSVTSEVAQWDTKVTNDVTQLGSLISQLQSDLATNPSTQAKINAMLVTTQQDVLSILPLLNVLDPNSQAKVAATINVIAAAITSVENIVNNIEGKVAMKATPFGTHAIHNGREFKEQFNAAVRANFDTNLQLQ